VILGDMAISALGALDVAIDPVTLEYTATPIAPRTGSGQGDNFQLSIRPFLAPRHLKLTGINRNPAGNLELTVRLTHPFAAPADLVGPPTGTKRVDLHVFDVNGILVSDGTDAFYNGAVLTNGDLLANADGYRDPGILFDKASFGIPVSGANVFPYRVFANGYDPASDRANQGNYDPANNGWQDAEFLAPSGFDVFAQGTSTEVIYELIPPISGSLDFALVITAKYQDPRSAGAGRTKRLPTGNPLDLRYILPEASGDLQRIVATVTGDLRDDRDTDLAQIDVQILDWDQDATVATVFPNNADLSESREDSAIGGVEMDFPSLNAALPVSGSAVSGVPANPMLWASTANVNNADLFDAGLGGEEVLGLIRVLDNQDLDDGSPTGIKPFILNEASTAPVSGATLSSTRYQIVRVQVDDLNGGGPLNDEAPGATTFTFPPSVIVDTPFDLDLDTAFPALATLDPDGLSLFEVDWENNGSWDESITVTTGTPAADFTHTYTVVNATQQYKLRITDNYPTVIDRLSTEYGPFTVDVEAAGGPITPTIGPKAPAVPTQVGATYSMQWDRFLQSLVSDGNGNLYITYRVASALNSIVRSSDGGVTWGTPAVMTGINSSNGGSLAVLANDEVVAAYISNGNSGLGGALSFMRITPGAGNTISINPVQTINATQEWRDPVIVADPSDATKAWILSNRDTTPTSVVTDQSDDSLQIYAVTSASTTPSFTLASTGIDPASHTGNLNDPGMAIDSGGILHIVWTNANTTAAPGNGLWYRAFNTATNVPVGTEERVSSAAQMSVTMHGNILLDQSANPVVFYDDAATTITESNVHVTRRVGTWSSPLLLTAIDTFGQNSPSAVRDNAGRFLVVWRDYRNGTANADIYGRFINPNLTVNGPEFIIDSGTDSTLHPRVAYHGATNSIACTWYNTSVVGSASRLERRVLTY